MNLDRTVLLVELNVAFRLTAEDAEVLPSQEKMVRGQGTRACQPLH